MNHYKISVKVTGKQTEKLIHIYAQRDSEARKRLGKWVSQHYGNAATYQITSWVKKKVNELD